MKHWIAILLAISFGVCLISCVSVPSLDIRPPHKIGESSHAKTETPPLAASYIKIVTPAADSNRPIYLDGCYIGTVASIDSIGMFTGAHSVSYLSEWEKRYYREFYNYKINCLYPGVPIFTGAGELIIMAGTWNTFLQPGQTQTVAMNYNEVQRTLASIERQMGNSFIWVLVGSLVVIAVGSIILVSSSGE